jgi:hypothetical protein
VKAARFRTERPFQSRGSMMGFFVGRADFLPPTAALPLRQKKANAAERGQFK